jgi:hypothetical protein
MMGRVAMRLAALARPAGTRSGERYRRAAVTLLASIATKGVALAVPVISVPLGLRYLGSERFGVWMTRVSAAGLLSFANLGFDKGLLTRWPPPMGATTAPRQGCWCRRPSSCWAASSPCCLRCSTPFCPGRGCSMSRAGLAGDAGPMMAALTICALLSLLANLVDTVQAAYQEGFLNGFWDGIGKFLALLALLTAIGAGASLPVLALAVAAAPLAASGANAALLFAKRRR